MDTLLFVILTCAAMLSVAYGLNCIVCSSATNLICEDPYKGDVSITSSLSQPGFTSCLKTMYWGNKGFYPSGAVIREGSPTICSASSSTGSLATLYCCSDKDNCNGATKHADVFLLILSFLVISEMIKRAILH